MKTSFKCYSWTLVTKTKLRPEWKNQMEKLDNLATEIYESKNYSRTNLIDRLAEIFDESYKELDVDVRIIVLIEFCFFKAGGLILEDLIIFQRSY